MSSDPEGAGTAGPGQSDCEHRRRCRPLSEGGRGRQGTRRSCPRTVPEPAHAYVRSCVGGAVPASYERLGAGRGGGRRPRGGGRVSRQSEPRESGPVPVLQRPPQRPPALLPDAVLGGDALDRPGRRRGRIHRPSLAIGSRPHDRRGACRSRGPGDGPARRRTVAVEDLRRGHAPRPVPAVPVGASGDRRRGGCRGVAVCDAADASPRPVARVRARVLGDVSGNGVSERHPRSAVPGVGRRRAGTSRVRLAGRASDNATGRGIACGARGDGARRASGSDTTDRRVALPRAGRSGPVVDPCHRSRRGRQPVPREVVAVRGLQGLRSASCT